MGSFIRLPLPWVRVRLKRGGVAVAVGIVGEFLAHFIALRRGEVLLLKSSLRIVGVGSDIGFIAVDALIDSGVIVFSNGTARRETFFTSESEPM